LEPYSIGDKKNIGKNMIQFQLTQSHKLIIENNDHRIRLIIMENEKELVCRKESIRKLEQCILLTETSIFKGRLQLFKQGNRIDILMKNTHIGSIQALDLQNGLSILHAEKMAGLTK